MKKRILRKKEVKQDCPYKDFLLLFPYADKEVQEELIKRLREQPRPDKLCGKEVPKDLNGISYGMLDDLRTATGNDDIAGACAKVLLGVEPEDLLKEDANDVFGFTSFVTEELKRINKIFQSIKVNYSKEEIAAGVKELDFGSFGVLDWYARRMGITNQNEVREVAWVRIFQCMKNDALKNEYERKLAKQYRPKTHKK
ncbi:MAG: hypothetical protein IKP36_05365 [Bacteroidaceae bacterium]|nr:hypothetical protein [Bacteroidaceae bacterium]